VQAGRIRLRTVAVLLFPVCCATWVSAQGACSVKEHPGTGTLTGDFSLEGITARLTVPNYLTALDPLRVRLEVSGLVQDELVLRSAYRSVPVRDGATLQVTRRPNERLIFSIATRDGRTLCSWEPRVLVPRKAYRVRNGFALLNEHWVRIAGDPIYILIGHDVDADSGDFRIDGLPATILAETPKEVILRDPRPVSGERTVESPWGQRIRLRFFNVAMSLQSTPRGETFMVHATGIALRRAGQLLLRNDSPQPVKFNCGRFRRSRGERGSGTTIGVLPGSSEIAVSCEMAPHELPIDLNDMRIMLIDGSFAHLFIFIL
jgi:hypothetical protein